MTKYLKAKLLIKSVLEQFNCHEEKTSDVLFNVYPQEMEALINMVMSLQSQSDAVELLAWYCQSGYDYMFYDGELTFHEDRDPISKQGITITELYNKWKEGHK